MDEQATRSDFGLIEVVKDAHHDELQPSGSGSGQMSVGDVQTVSIIQVIADYSLTSRC